MELAVCGGDQRELDRDIDFSSVTDIKLCSRELRQFVEGQQNKRDTIFQGLNKH